MKKELYEKYDCEELREYKKQCIKDLKDIYNQLGGKDFFDKSLAEKYGYHYKHFNEYDVKTLKEVNKMLDDTEIVTFVPVDTLVELDDAIEDGKEFIYDQNLLKQQKDELFAYFLEFMRNEYLELFKEYEII